MTNEEKKRLFAVLRATEYLFLENIALKLVLEHRRIANWQKFLDRLLSDKEMMAGVRLKFTVLYPGALNDRGLANVFRRCNFGRLRTLLRCVVGVRQHLRTRPYAYHGRCLPQHGGIGGREFPFVSAIVVLVVVVPLFLVHLPIFRWFTELLMVIWLSLSSPFVCAPRPGLITAAEILTRGYDPDDFDFEQIDGVAYGRRRCP